MAVKPTEKIAAAAVTTGRGPRACRASSTQPALQTIAPATMASRLLAIGTSIGAICSAVTASPCQPAG